MSFYIGPLGLIICIFLGIITKYIGLFKSEDYSTISKTVVNITMPIMIFTQYQNFERKSELFLLVLLGFFFSVLPILICFFITRKETKSKRAFFMLHSGGYNIGGFALPIVLALLGPEAAMTIIFFDVGNSINATGGTYALTTYLLDLEGESAIKGTINKFLKSPPFMMYLLVILMYTLKVEVPPLTFELLKPIASANSFLATFMLGTVFSLPSSKDEMRIALKIVRFRFFIFLLFGSAIYILCAEFLILRKTIIILLASPIGMLSSVYTEKIKGDVELSSFTIITSVVFSLSLMFILYVFL